METRHYDFIDSCYEKNDELTSIELQKLIKEKFDLEVSSGTIKKTRKKLGWTLSGPKYCQLIREANQVARLEFCLELQRNNETFDDIIFTNESTIMMDKHGKICFRKKDRLPRLKPTPKHPYKVHVWAGISKRGPTKIAIFSGIMKK